MVHSRWGCIPHVYMHAMKLHQTFSKEALRMVACLPSSMTEPARIHLCTQSLAAAQQSAQARERQIKDIEAATQRCK